jgi:hypothetical protein
MRAWWCGSFCARTNSRSVRRPGYFQARLSLLFLSSTTNHTAVANKNGDDQNPGAGRVTGTEATVRPRIVAVVWPSAFRMLMKAAKYPSGRIHRTCLKNKGESATKMTTAQISPVSQFLNSNVGMGNHEQRARIAKTVGLYMARKPVSASSVTCKASAAQSASQARPRRRFVADLGTRKTLPLMNTDGTDQELVFE